MTDPSPARIALIALTFLVAGMVKGVSGMGLPTVAMGLLGAVMPTASAASLLILPSFVTNVWQLLGRRRFGALARRLSTMMAGIVAGTLASAWFMASDHGWTRVALGVTLMLYACYGLAGRPLAIPPRAERWLSPVVGIATGLITGATGVFVIPAVPYVQALGLDKEDLIQALGLSFTVSTVALAIGLTGGGAFATGDIAASTLAVAPALIGMWAGQHVRRRVSIATFKRCFFACLLLLGLQLVVRPLF